MCPAQTLPARSVASPGSNSYVAKWLWKSDLALCPFLGAIGMPALHGHSDLQGRASPRHVPETLYPAWATLLLCGPHPACGPGAQDKRADQTASQARRLMLPVPFLPSSPRGGLRGTKGPEVASCRPVLGQQVRGKEGLPVEAGTDSRGRGGTVREAESRGADAGDTA